MKRSHFFNHSQVKWIFIVILWLFLLGFKISLYHYYLLFYTPLLPPGHEAVVLDMKPHASANTLVNNLYELKLIPSKSYLKLLIHGYGLSKNLKAGIYQIKEGESPAHFLHRMAIGDVLVESFHIIEGTTIRDVVYNLYHAPYLTIHADTFADSLKKIGHDSELKHSSNVEGLFLADTYYYDAGSSAVQLLHRAHHHLLNVLNDAWEHRSRYLPYKNPYELLIAASIIEKETAIPLERQIIAGIIVNRLKKKMPLQMDPTVIYALMQHCDTPDNCSIHPLQHKNLMIQSKYNTYYYRGLPPTPIAMVGKISIHAAANPKKTDYLYFYAKGDGSHQFSTTYNEQRKAINVYRPLSKKQ